LSGKVLAGSFRRSPGTRMIRVGLLGLVVLAAAPWSASGANGVEIDQFSRDCIVCHDGAGATSVGVDLRNNPESRHSRVNSITSDHPIGMKYNNYVALDRGYKALPMDTNMVFVNGAVGCLTCHDPLNLEKGHLVKSDQKSQLCLSCHNK
jgi:predicted CXXCH cytochrome family protein